MKDTTQPSPSSHTRFSPEVPAMSQAVVVSRTTAMSGAIVNDAAFAPRVPISSCTVNAYQDAHRRRQRQRRDTCQPRRSAHLCPVSTDQVPAFPGVRCEGERYRSHREAGRSGARRVRRAVTERIYFAEQISGLPAQGIEPNKIRALFLAYGGEYDFCRFFRQGSTFLAALDGSFVIAEQPGADIEELAQFLALHGFTDIFCSEDMGQALPAVIMLPQQPRPYYPPDESGGKFRCMRSAPPH